MNIRQKYEVERIVKEMVAANRDKPLNELKRIIKEKNINQIYSCGPTVYSYAHIGILELIYLWIH